MTVGDSELESNFWINKSITLDLGGHTLTGDYQIAVGVNAANAIVTIQNGTIVGGTGYGAYLMAGTLTLDRITINDDVERPVQIDSGTGHKLTIRNSTISSTEEDQYGIMNFGDKSTIIIENSVIAGDTFPIYHNGSYYGLTLTATGSTITSTNPNSPAIYLSGSTTTTASNGGENHKAVFTDCIITGATGIETKYTGCYHEWLYGDFHS